MLRRLHDRLGTAGLIVAVIAVVAALGGSALAASNALTGKQKKEVKKIAKQFAGEDGAPGAAGSQGPAGAQGAKGDTGEKGETGEKGAKGETGEEGAKGETGEKGAKGESVTITPIAKNPANLNCPEGGAKFSNLAEEEAFACNGESGGEGSYPTTLPSGHTASGFWEAQEIELQVFGTLSLSTISFPLPLENAPTKTFVRDGGSTAEEKEKCPGNFAAPKAVAGYLCLYPAIAGEVPTPLNAGEEATKFGAGVLFESTTEEFGSWAVTAP